jgi:hypothetical protein
MHTRRLITFLLGAWFALVLSVAGMTTTGFQVANNVGKTPPGEATRALVLVGEPMSGYLFRYVAAEINRTVCEYAGLAELGILFAMASLLLLQNYSRPATLLAGMMLLAAVASHFLLTPQIVAQGRILDFRGLTAMSAERESLTQISRLDGVLVVFRLLCGGWIAVLLMYRGPNSRLRRRRGNGDAVDHAQDSHVNG